ncbi:MAG: hypothetical protein JWL63_1282 [Rhodocyclales bacterium]|nr:hypothetical protein [Rhodocyclales bacterium]
MSRINGATGHQPVEPDRGPESPPQEEPSPGIPQPKHRDPEDPDYDDAD